MDEFEAESDRLRQVRAGYYEKVEEIKEQLQKAYVVQNTAKMNADQAGARVKASRDLVEDIQKEAQDLDRQITDIVDNQESINVELDTSQELENQLTAKIEEEQAVLDQEHEVETEKQKVAEEMHLVCAGLEQKYDFVLENVTRIQAEMEKFQEELKELEENNGGTSREIQEKEEKIQDLRQTIENSGELFQEIQAN